MYLKLAWRNIWRNKLRTAITMAAIFVAVILSTLMGSLKEGTYANMIESMIGAYTGYVQIHAKGYWADKTIDNSFAIKDTLVNILKNTRGVSGFLPRIESFALATSDSITKGAMVVGVDPGAEQQYTNLQDRVVEGSYLDENDEQVLVGTGLAEYLKLKVGDSIILLGQGYHASSAAGLYRIKGLVKFGSPEYSKQLIFMPIKAAQYFYSTEDQVTNLVVQLNNPDDAAKIAERIQTQTGESYEVMDWEQLAPDIKSMIETDRVEGYVFMFILYMVISFGIFGTMLMMLAERLHEFGVLIAIGMKRFRLAIVVWMEIIILSILGAFIGVLGAFPVCGYFYWRPVKFGEDVGKMMEDYGMEAVLQASIDPPIFIRQGIIIFLIACIIAIYPFVKLLRLNAIKAMRS